MDKLTFKRGATNLEYVAYLDGREIVEVRHTMENGKVKWVADEVEGSTREEAVYNYIKKEGVH